MFVIYPYIGGSKGAKMLSEVLGARILRRVGSRWRGTARDYMINWGSQRVPNNGARIINDPRSVSRAANKISAFRAFREHQVRTPEWTTDRAVAQGWANTGTMVICRRLISASEGRGIEISNPNERVPDVPLYTKYIKKKHEYRIHVMNGEVIDYVEKRRRRGGINHPIRNTANGYIFAREGVNVPEDVFVQARAAVRALELDFGAVDVIYNDRLRAGYVLEVNTAPGNTGTTTRRYAEALRRFFR